MMAATKDRHGWLRVALMDRGKQQKDVATAWNTDAAAVSRFIKEGAPALTWDRAEALAAMLGMDMNELKLRLAEGLPPRRQPNQVSEKHPPRVDGPTSTTVALPPNASNGEVDHALAALREAVKTARGALPGAKISVSIKYEVVGHENNLP